MKVLKSLTVLVVVLVLLLNTVPVQALGQANVTLESVNDGKMLLSASGFGTIAKFPKTAILYNKTTKITKNVSLNWVKCVSSTKQCTTLSVGAATGGVTNVRFDFSNSAGINKRMISKVDSTWWLDYSVGFFNLKQFGTLAQTTQIVPHLGAPSNASIILERILLDGRAEFSIEMYYHQYGAEHNFTHLNQTGIVKRSYNDETSWHDCVRDISRVCWWVQTTNVSDIRFDTVPGIVLRSWSDSLPFVPYGTGGFKRK